MTMRCLIPLMLGLTSGGCSVGGLSESEARKVLEHRLDEAQVATCRLSLVKQRADGTYSILDDSGHATMCFDTVEKLGFAKRGKCRDEGGATRSGTCFDRTVTPEGETRGHASGFLVPCGTFELVGIDSMKKVGEGLVSVTYTRDFVLRPAADPTGSCGPGRAMLPERGTQSKSLAMEKQADGTWSIPHLDPHEAAHVL